TAEGSLIMAWRAGRMATCRPASISATSRLASSCPWSPTDLPPRADVLHHLRLDERDRPQPRLAPPLVGRNAGKQSIDVFRRLGEDEIPVGIHPGAVEEAVEMAARPQI